MSKPILIKIVVETINIISLFCLRHFSIINQMFTIILIISLPLLMENKEKYNIVPYFILAPEIFYIDIHIYLYNQSTLAIGDKMIFVSASCLHISFFQGIDYKVCFPRVRYLLSFYDILQIFWETALGTKCFSHR